MNFQQKLVQTCVGAAGRLLQNYAGAPHGISDTHKEKLNANLLEFIKS